MKKGGVLILVVVTLSVGILLGFFLARNSASGVVLLSPAVEASDTQEALSYGLDINKASVSQLTELPGIGETLAGRIVAYRDENGAFTSVEDLLAIDGIGKKTVEQIKHLVKVGD